MNLLLVLLALASPQTPATSEVAYARLKPSLFTIERHSGNLEAKSSLRSGDTLEVFYSLDLDQDDSYEVLLELIADEVKSASGSDIEWLD